MLVSFMYYSLVTQRATTERKTLTPTLHLGEGVISRKVITFNQTFKKAPTQLKQWIRPGLQ